MPKKENFPPYSSYYPFFDYLRGICALTVLIAHEGLLPSYANASNFAVQVFFALSGWLVGGMLLKLKPNDLFRFYFNRALRIWVPYYLCALILLMVSIYREPITAKWIEIVAYKLTFVYNLFGTPQLEQYVNQMPQKGTLNHFWSVNAEEQFYLLSPILLVIFPKYGRSYVTWTVITGLAFIFDLYPSIFLGVLAAVFFSIYGPAHQLLIGRVLLIIILLGSCYGMTINYELHSPLAALCIILLVAIPGTALPYGKLIGGMSYPLYLNQWMGNYISNFFLKESIPLVRHTASIAICILIAMAMYWWIDRNILAHRSSWYNLNRGISITIFAYFLLLTGLLVGFIYKPYVF